jgi:hypothetical protein
MEVMAAKVRIMKLLQEIRGFAEITQRRPQPRQPAALFLIQLRSHVFHTTATKRKQTIAVDMLEHPDIPHPVKITHLQPAAVPPVPVSSATAAVAAS